MKTSTQLSCCCWVRKTNPSATEQPEKFHVKWGDLSITSFADYSQRPASQVLQEKARSTADWSAQHARVIFGMQFKRRWRDNKQTYIKTETCKLYSRVFRIIKIDPCNFELYRFKVGPFFETQCIIPQPKRLDTFPWINILLKSIHNIAHRTGWYVIRLYIKDNHYNKRWIYREWCCLIVLNRVGNYTGIFSF